MPKLKLSKNQILIGVIAAGVGLLYWYKSSSLRDGNSLLANALDYAGSVGKKMKTSQAGLNAIKQREGVRLKTYLDTAGLPTIGVGHLLGAFESYPNGITEEKANSLLIEDLATAENAVNANVKVPVSQNQFDSLVSFVFNIGGGAFRSSTALRLLNAGDYRGAALAMSSWNKITQGGAKVADAGLTNRRNSEISQFLA